MENKDWFAVLRDTDDTDWGTGSFDFDEAAKMAAVRDCHLLAVINGDYNPETGEMERTECKEIIDLEVE